MNEDIEHGNAFAIPDLYKSSSLAHLVNATPTIEDLQPLSLLDEPHVNLPFSEDLKSGLLDLPTFEYGPFEDVGVLEDSSVSSLESLPVGVPEVVDEDLWTSLQSSKDDQVSTSLKSWETFHDKRFQEPRTAFLSEAGPQVFDAAIVKSAESASPESLDAIAGTVIRSEAILSSLTQLALGRESVLYYYNGEERSFQPCKNDIRMSGYSLQTFSILSESLRIQGNRVRDLQDFIAKTQQSSMASPAYVALAGAFLPILASLEAQIASPLVPIRSLLQLQALVERPGQVLICLSDVLTKIRGTRTDEDILSKVYELVQNAEHSPTWLLSILHGLLVVVSRPWLESVDGWLGLQQQNCSSFQRNFPAFVVARDRGAAAEAGFNGEITDFEYEPSLMPSFIALEDASVIFETGRSLRLLEVHQPDHPLLKPSTLASDHSTKLEWQFSWQDIEKVSKKAKEYESGLRKALQDFHSDSLWNKKDSITSKFPQQQNYDTTERAKQSSQALIESSIAAFEKPLLEPTLSSSLHPASDYSDHDTSTTFAPPISLLPTLSFNPLISARARLINHAKLRLLFKTHHLRSHLSLLHRYTLLSDGVFTSRLSHALFSPYLPQASDHRSLPRSIPLGLNLNHRSTWPPASSELRLALTGLLAESYFSSTTTINPHSQSTTLPGNLNFAIRPLTPTELETVSDPATLPALDFLHLAYTPPTPISQIITPTSVQKYDRISKFLLRLLRLLSVSTQLSPSHPYSKTVIRSAATRPHPHLHATSFRIEIAHFVNAVSAFFVDGVARSWVDLDRGMRAFETVGVDDNAEAEAMGVSIGEGWEAAAGTKPPIPALRALHTAYLDRILFSLLLCARQTDVLALLEEIFAFVLRFRVLLGRLDRDGDGDSGIDSDRKRKGGAASEIPHEITQLYHRFRGTVRRFVDACRGLSLGSATATETETETAAAGTGTGTGTAGDFGIFAELVARFEGNGFYAR